MRFTYEVIIKKDPDSTWYLAEFPDIEGATTQGKNIEDAVEMAADLLEVIIVSEHSEGNDLPNPTYGHTSKDGHVIAISVCPRCADEVFEASITTAEAAFELGVSDRRVRQLIAAGKLKADKKGRMNLVDFESVKALRDTPRKAGRPKKQLVATLT